jgi:hypothetical protein
MIMLITCLRDPKCGPLSLVIDFSELIGAELDHTPKREIVPGGMLYKCEIYKNFEAWEAFVSRVQIGLYNIDSRQQFLRVLLNT